jgi:NAD(P)-dependent dehydrogenase (short-subunit alcohol dehydrogenase family)
MATASQVALVTGVSSGIGRSTALALVGAGFKVFGTVRKPDADVPKGVERLVLDVCHQASVDAAVAELMKRAGRIDVLVNNAGASLAGAIEETQVEQAQALFDVNFFGVVRVTRAVLPVMRAQGAGRVLIVGSVVGFLPMPFFGFYAASKHALEGYAESLDHEVRDLGIRIVLLEPGFMKTRIDQNSAVAAASIDAYASQRARATAAVNAAIDRGEDPELVAKVVVEAARVARPNLRYTIGRGAGTLKKLRSFVPSGLFDRSFRSRFRLDG